MTRHAGIVSSASPKIDAVQFAYTTGPGAALRPEKSHQPTTTWVKHQ